MYLHQSKLFEETVIAQHLVVTRSFFQFSQREQCKKLHKMYFEGFHMDNWEDMAPRVKIVEEFFYDIFKNYNVQFWGMLDTEKLVDSPENAMAKLAIDIIHR